LASVAVLVALAAGAGVEAQPARGRLAARRAAPIVVNTGVFMV
jgi:hypothetical protein